MQMRGGTSKGAYFLRDELPADPAERADLLMRVMGTPDPRQIDGIGGAHPLTSKVAVVAPSSQPDADVDYLFLQLGVDEAFVTDRQNCGNLLAGVGPFAVERGLVKADGDRTAVRINMLNTGGTATAAFATPDGRVRYAGGPDDTEISGVPGAAAPIVVTFDGTEGASCGSLLPTGRVRDEVEGVAVTCVDNGMPTVLIGAADLGVRGDESPADLEADEELGRRVQAIRLAAGPMMNLGDVSGATVPKMTLVSPPRAGGSICTRTFIPVRCHTSIGVLGAVSVATGLLMDGAVGHDLLQPFADRTRVRIEHPTGYFDVESADGRTGVVRTARKLFDGTVFPRTKEVA